jgi:hypothetical protein
MPHFVQNRLHDKALPAAYVPLLRALDRFIETSEEARRQRTLGIEADLDGLRRLYDRAMPLARAHPVETAHIPDGTAIRAFAAGVLRALHYRDTVLGGLPVVDLVGSRTLSDFDVDLDAEASDQVHAALRRAFGLDDAAFAELYATLDPELRDLEARQELVRALDGEHPLTGDPDAASFALWDALFPGSPLRLGEVRVLRTGSSVFFCIPYADNALTDPVGDRTDAELAEVTRYLANLTKFHQRFLAHFPVFGAFRAERADPALMDRLQARTGLPRAKMLRKLTTMVTVLPTAEVDQYVVHDAWGHQWQAALFEFEDRYQEAATYSAMPDVHADFGGHTLLGAARSLADGHGFEAYDAYLHAAFAHRLTVTLNGLFAEVLADIVEYKYLWLHPEHRDRMPSSSFFKERPTKLDLTLWDLPHYFGMAQRGFERLATTGGADLALALAAEGLDDPDVAAQLADRTAGFLDEVYRTSLRYDPHDDRVHVNVFARVALQFATFQAHLDDLYDRLSARPVPEGLPLSRFQDLLVFTTASFLDASPLDHFWFTDDFVGGPFEPLFTRFVEALAEG